MEFRKVCGRCVALAVMAACGSIGQAATKYWDAASGAGNGVGGTGTWGTTFSLSAAGDASLTTAGASDALIFQGTAGVVQVGATVPSSSTAFSSITFNVTGYTLKTDTSTTAREINSTVTLSASVELKLGDAAVSGSRTMGFYSIGGDATSALTIQGSHSSTSGFRINLNGPTGGSVDVPVTITDPGVAGFVSNVASVSNTISANIFNNAGGYTMLGANTANCMLTVNGTISGNSGLHIGTGANTTGGAGVVLLNSANTYTGTTRIANSYVTTPSASKPGVLRLGIDDALADTPVVWGFPGTDLQGGLLDLAGHDQRVASIAAGETLTVAAQAGNGVTNSSQTVKTLTIDGTTGATSTFRAVIGKATGTGLASTTFDTIVLKLASKYNGTLILTNTNTYTGGTTIEGGTLQADGAIGGSAGALAVNADGHASTLNLNVNQIVAGLSGTVANAGTASINVASSKTLTVSQAGDSSYAGNITGSGAALTKNGNGTLTIGGTTSYSGTTAVGGGRLNVVSLPNSAVNVTAGTIAGSGTFGQGVTIGAAGTLTVGTASSTGQLTLAAGADLSASGATYVWKLATMSTSGAGSSYDQLLLTGGTLTVGSGAKLTLDFSTMAAGQTPGAGNAFWDSTQQWTIADVSSGTVSAAFAAGNIALVGGTTSQGSFTTALDTGRLILTYAPLSLSWRSTLGGGTGTWDASGGTNWSGGGWDAANAAIFSTGAGGTVTLSGPIAAKGVAFRTDGYTIAGTDTLTLGTSGIAGQGSATISAPVVMGVNQEWRVDSGKTVLVGGGVGESSSGLVLTKSGAGTLVLNGASTYSGGTVVKAGVLEAEWNGALGTAAGGVTLDGGTLRTVAEFAPFTSARGFSVTSNGGTIEAGGATLLSLSGTNTLTGTLTKTGAGELSIVTGGFTGAGGLTLSAGGVTIGDVTSTSAVPTNFLGTGAIALGDATRLTVASAGAVSLANTGVSISGGAAIKIQNTTAGPGSATVSWGASLTLASGSKLTVEGANLSSDGVAGGSVTFNRLEFQGLALQGPATLQTTASGSFGTGLSFTGVLNDGGFTTTFHGQGSSDVLPGAGVFLFRTSTSGTANSLTGNWAISNSEGTEGVVVAVNRPMNLTSGTITVYPRGQLWIDTGTTTGTWGSAGQTIYLSGTGAQTSGGSGASGALRVASSGTVTHTLASQLSLTADTMISIAANQTLVTTGVISGAGKLRKSGGSGTLEIDAVATNDGGTDVLSGTLTIGAAGGLSSGKSLNLFSTRPGGGGLSNQDVTVIFNNAAQIIGTLTSGFDSGGTGGANKITLNGTALTITQATAAVFGPGGAGQSSLIEGTGSLIKDGAATLTLSGANTYGGGTTITTGRLAITNTSGSATGTGGVTVNGGSIGGTGAISGTVTINPGGTLAQNAGETLTVGAMTLNTGIAIPATAGLTVGGGISGAGAAIGNEGTLTLGGTSTVGDLDGAAISDTLFSGATVVQSGATLTAARIRQDSLALADTGKVRIAESSGTLDEGWPGGSNGQVSFVRNLTLTGASQLDVYNNDLVIDYAGDSPYADFEAAVKRGYAGGAWNGTGIVSTDAAWLNYFTVLVLDTATAGAAYDDASTDSSSIVLKFTHQDDLNGDGVVDATDKGIFTSHWSDGATGATHRFGDMDFDSTYTFNDVQLFNLYYNTALPSLPEPGSLVLLALGAAGLLARRRR